MSQALRAATASQEIMLGPFLDSTDGDTEETGLTIANTDIAIWKRGATTYVNPAAGATHVQDGMYLFVADATDSGTIGDMKIHVHVAGALFVVQECFVYSGNIYDSIYSNSIVLPANVTQWNTTNVATPTVAGVPEVDLTHVAGVTTDVSTIPASIAAILVDTGTTLDGRIPAALVSGRMDSSVGAAAADTLTASALATDAVSEIVTAMLTTAATEAYSTDGGTVTLAQFIYETLAALQEHAKSGTTWTFKKRDGSTTAFVLTLDSATAPSTATRSS